MSNRTHSPAIDRVLEFLATDKEWHTISEIAQNTALPKQEVADIVNFLAANHFISLSEQGKKAKITENVAQFLTQIREEEKLSAH